MLLNRSLLTLAYLQLMFSKGWVFRDGMRDEARKFANVSALVYVFYKATLY